MVTGEWRMKKVYFGLFLLVLSIMLTTFSYIQVNAEETSNTTEIETIYPENILDYTNLSGISAFDINNDYIIYTKNKNDIILFEKETRDYTTISGLNEINKIKFASDFIIVADSENIKVIKNFNSAPQIFKINEISVLNAKAIDIYVNEDYIYIAVVDNTTFKLFKYNLDLTFETNNPILTITPSIDFSKTFMVAINDKSAYIVYKTSTGEKYTTGLCVLDYDKDYNSESIEIIETFWTNARVIDTFWFEDNEFLVTFTNEIFYLLSPSNQKYASINISTQGDLETNTFPIFEITDINFFNNLIYVSDSTYKTIQTFEISLDETDFKLQSKEIVLCGNSFDRGRFDGVKDIFVQGQDLYVSDTLNNRIQILKNNHSEFISGLSSNSTPHSTRLDANQNLYFVETEASQSKLVRYKYENDAYTLDNKFFKVNGVNIGNISDICIAKSNSVFVIDSDNDKIYYLVDNNLVELTNTTLNSIDFTSTSQIEYVKKVNKFVISSDNNLYYINTDGEVLNSLNIPNLKEITSDFDSIYAITNNKIHLINCLENSLGMGDYISFDTTNYTSFSFDILSRKMFAFDCDRSCLVKFDCKLSTTPFTLSDITKTQALQTKSIVLPLKLTNNFIYDYPYELGNVYEMNSENNNCIGIEEYDEYYRVLFENENQLKSGYIKKSNAQKIDYVYKPIDVITTNQLVPVYKYPTLLKYEDERLIVKNLEINTSIKLLYTFPVSLDEKEFYLYQFGDNIGFIFNADVVLKESTTIKNLNTENASIRLIGKDTTELLDEDKETKILILNDKDRIFVENYDKNEKYTKVIIKDKDLNTIEGYVLTKDIQMDELDNSKLILILIIVASVIILALIVVSYFVIKKRNK